ncbi:MAG: hypothetical protein ABIN74_11815 [Ferruginibacter sp.]
MPQTNCQGWLNTLKRSLCTGALYSFISALLFLLVFCLYVYCLSLLVNSAKTTTVAADTSVFTCYRPLACDKASGMSEFFIKLPHYMPTDQLAPHRLVIYASDIRQLTGCSKSSSQRQLVSIKLKLGKQHHQYLTIEEYCSEKGFNYEKTLQQLKLK